MNILFIIDPLEKLILHEDTSFCVMAEASKRGHRVFECQIEDLYAENGQVRATARNTQAFTSPNHTWKSEPSETIALNDMQVIFMRKDPPYTHDYLTATYLLSLVDRKKTFIVNTPESLRLYNEKLLTLEFAEYCPETLVTGDKKLIRDFVHKHSKAIIKPLYSYGGKGICMLSEGDLNMNSIIELVTKGGKEHVMIQRYLPEALKGDIRVVTLGSQILGAENRVASGNDHRNNISSGGTYEKTILTPEQQKIAETIARKLPSLGIYFAGVDLIGNFVTEINITSPTGVATINTLEGTHLETHVVDFFEAYEKYLSN